MKNIKWFVKILFAILTFGVAIISMENELMKMTKKIQNRSIQITDDNFRRGFFGDEQLSQKEQYSSECKTILTNVENDVSYFPVAESSVDKALTVSYVNSWMSERSFGGKRGHEGTDIMASKNQRGLYPVVSMSNGTITNLGWLEKGGYRVGITSDSGIYYYYAHLESYSNIKEGQRVKAGELLGFMGDSGYGPEGTTGKFAVHLHVGIYAYVNGEEVSLNPYYVLRSIKKRITFS